MGGIQLVDLLCAILWQVAVFQQNLTSKLIVETVRAHAFASIGSVVELGCGSGWITSELLDYFDTSTSFCLSDISEEAIRSAQSRLKGVANCDFRVGPGLDPWTSSRFDLIINDIAGIADEIATNSDWYNGVPFSAGSDGLKNSVETLSRVSSFLNSVDSCYVVPLISLSRVDAHRELLQSTFDMLHFGREVWWPLPDTLAKNRNLLSRLADEKTISIREKYGKTLASTQVCIAMRPIVYGGLH